MNYLPEVHVHYTYTYVYSYLFPEATYKQARYCVSCLLYLYKNKSVLESTFESTSVQLAYSTVSSLRRELE